MIIQNLAKTLLDLPPERRTGLAIATGVALLFLSAFMLMAISRPVRFDRRTSALDRQIARAEAIQGDPSYAPALDVGAICRSANVGAINGLRGDLIAMMAARRFKRLEVATSVESGPLAGLAPIRFALDANGRYANAVGMIEDLQLYKLAVALQRVDIVAKPGFTHLHMDGRVFCRPRATS